MSNQRASFGVKFEQLVKPLANFSQKPWEMGVVWRSVGGETRLNNLEPQPPCIPLPRLLGREG